jgi:hypothetical protein
MLLQHAQQLCTRDRKIETIQMHATSSDTAPRHYVQRTEEREKIMQMYVKSLQIRLCEVMQKGQKDRNLFKCVS